MKIKKLFHRPSQREERESLYTHKESIPEQEKLLGGELLLNEDPLDGNKTYTWKAIISQNDIYRQPNQPSPYDKSGSSVPTNKPTRAARPSTFNQNRGPDATPENIVHTMIEWCASQQQYYWQNVLSGETDLREFFQKFCVCDLCIPRGYAIKDDQYQEALVNSVGEILTVASNLPDTSTPIVGQNTMGILPNSLHNSRDVNRDKKRVLVSVDNFIVRAKEMQFYEDNKDREKQNDLIDLYCGLNTPTNWNVPNLVLVAGLKTLYGKNLSSEQLTLMNNMLYYIGRRHLEKKHPFVAVIMN